jgi:hypothetical protein
MKFGKPHKRIPLTVGKYGNLVRGTVFVSTSSVS